MKKIFKILAIVISVIVLYVLVVMIWFMYQTKDEQSIMNFRCQSGMCKGEKTDCLSSCIKDADAYKCIYNNYYGEESNLICSKELIER